MQPLLGLVDANKTLPNFFSAPFESFLEIFAKRVYESNFATFFGDFNFDILLTVLDVFSVLGFHFVLGGYLIKRVFVY